MALSSKVYEHSKNILEPLNGIWNNYVKPTVSETIKIFPDSLLFGTGLIALLTFSPAYFVFFLGILEIGLIQASVASFIVGISPVFTKKVVNECATGYKYSSLYQLSAALASSADKASIPDKLIFVLSAASFYMYAMFLYFNTSLTMLGPIMMERVTAGIVMSGLLLATVVLWRLFINKCDSMSHLIISFVMGAFGMLIFFQNALLFGDANVNILSVPLLQTGLPVCAPTGP